ncbi:MAG: thioredoxin family protein [Actinomycetota bacterium]|nr:thioredoxin family protein [Actinomycetota bacterium]
MSVELLYFDGCPNWRLTDQRLREALRLAGRCDEVVYRRVETAEQAVDLGFHGSPTLLVDGRDPLAVPDAQVGLACRVFRTPAGLAGAPTVEQLVALLRAESD